MNKVKRGTVSKGLGFTPRTEASYQVLLGEAEDSKALPIVLVFHLLLIYFGEGNDVTSVTKTCEQTRFH